MKFVSPRLCRSSSALSAGVAAVFTFLFFALVPAAMAAPITGTVMNLTTKKPSAGDTVALIRLAQGMQEAAHTTTDARGHYTLQVTNADQMHLVRVTHDKANYFQPAPSGTQNVNVDVYNSAEKVPGVSTEAEVWRMEADQSGMRVTENFFVKNASSPPRTQFGPRAYEIYLPREAQIVSSAALGPGSMPVQSSPVPLGEPGHYTFVFPLRPGETRFQISYRLPYTGGVQFKPQVATTVDNLAIILPKSMQFSGTPAVAFQPIDEDVNVQTYLAKNVTPGAKLTLHISGTGQLPQEGDANGSQGGGAQAGGAQANGGQAGGPESGQAASAASDNRPGGGLGVPIDTPDPLHKYKWWIISLVVVLLAVGAGFSMKQANSQAAAIPGAGARQGLAPSATVVAASTTGRLRTAGGVRGPVNGNVLDVLKEELFVLETERLESRIDPEEYDRQKAALEVVLKRALERVGRNRTDSVG